MELKQLRALQAIADTGSFSEAAEQLGLTPSALSHQLRALEEELGETLLIRARPKVYASPAGLAVLATTQRILAEVAALEARFAQAKRGPVTGTLRVAASNLAIVYVFGDLCQAFIKQYPGIDLAIRSTENPVEAVRRVIAGTADVAFSPLFVENDQLTRIVLGRTEHAFIVCSGHPLSNRTTVTLAELKDYPFVLYQPGSGTRWLTDELFLSESPSILTESNDTEFIKRMVAIGPGVALIPVYALGAEARSGQLRLLRYAGPRLMADFGIVHRKNVRMNSIELFKALCLDLRGPGFPEITIENAGDTPFRHGA